MTRLTRITLALLACGFVFRYLAGGRSGIARIDCAGSSSIRRAARCPASPSPSGTSGPTRRSCRRPTTRASTPPCSCCRAPTPSSVELSGFQKREYQSVQVHVGERVQLDVTLAPAASPSRCSSSARARSSKPARATMGQVIDAKLITEIPLGDGTAYGLTRLIPGATFERSYALQRPMDNDNLRGMTVTGTISSEFTIDGSSNVVSQARAGIQPPAEAIQEFKVDTAAYDAQIGHTGAGSVNLALKSGTNQFHGSGSFYNRDDSRSEDLFASIRNNTGKTPRTTTATARRSAARSSRTRRSSWRRSRSCRTTPRSRSPARCRRRRCGRATSPSCWPPACRFSIRARRALSTASSPAIRFRATSFRPTG